MCLYCTRRVSVRAHLAVGQGEDGDGLQQEDVHLGGLEHGDALAKEHVGSVDMRMGHELEVLAQLQTSPTQAAYKDMSGCSAS